MTVHDIHILFDYNYWAKARLLGVVETLSPEQFMKDLGSSHGGIHGTLVHIMAAEEIWLRRWRGESPSTLRTTDEFPTFDAMKNHWDKLEHEMMGFCHSLKSEEDILREVSFRDTRGNTHTQLLYRMMQHLVNHSTYHRGQVVTMLRQSGVKPVGTDLITYYHKRS